MSIIMSRKYIFLITVCILAFQICLYGNQANSEQQFTKNLENLRNISSDLSFQRYVLVDLIVNNPTFRGNLALGFLITQVSEISSLSHVYVLQLNKFDTVIAKRTGQKALIIPKRVTDYCCWKNISLVHMNLSYNAQETIRDEVIQNINLHSPQILHQLKNTLEKLRTCLRYFDHYFAERE